MKTVILAGGKGTRLAEETVTKPKPMVEIGRRPILWHLMKIYESHGFVDFVVTAGYRAEMIFDYFRNFHLYDSEVTFDMRTGEMHWHNRRGPNWRVTVAWTGLETQTGGRVGRVAHILDEKRFMLTYGDSIGNVDVGELVKRHEKEGRIATVTAVRPPSRFGTLDIEESRVMSFKEKPQLGGGWINGGYMVFERDVLDYIKSDSAILEREVLERLAQEEQLAAYKHEGFWQPMDNIREKQRLEELWAAGEAPWKNWED